MKSKMFFNKFEIFEFVKSLSEKIDVNGSGCISGWGLKLTTGEVFREPNYNHWIGRLATELNLPFDKDMSRKYGSQFCVYFKDIEEIVEEAKEEVLVVESEEVVEDFIDLEKAKKLRTKKALDEYAQEFGYELDARKSLKNMMKQLEELVSY